MPLTSDVGLSCLFVWEPLLVHLKACEICRHLGNYTIENGSEAFVCKRQLAFNNVRGAPVAKSPCGLVYREGGDEWHVLSGDRKRKSLLYTLTRYGTGSLHHSSLRGTGSSQYNEIGDANEECKHCCESKLSASCLDCGNQYRCGWPGRVRLWKSSQINVDTLSWDKPKP